MSYFGIISPWNFRIPEPGSQSVQWYVSPGFWPIARGFEPYHSQALVSHCSLWEIPRHHRKTKNTRSPHIDLHIWPRVVLRTFYFLCQKWQEDFHWSWIWDFRAGRSLPQDLTRFIGQRPNSRKHSLPTVYSYCWMAEIRLTTWDVWNPTNNGIFTISTGAGFLPSTVVVFFGSKVCPIGFVFLAIFYGFEFITIWENIFGTLLQASKQIQVFFGRHQRIFPLFELFCIPWFQTRNSPKMVWLWRTFLSVRRSFLRSSREGKIGRNQGYLDVPGI